MATDFIKVARTDTNAIFAADLLTAVRITQDLRVMLQKLTERGFHQFETADFAEFESNHGLPAGAGQIVFDMLNGMMLALKGQAQNAEAINFCERVG